MKTNSKQYRANFAAYLMDCLSGSDELGENFTMAEAANYMNDRILSEMGWMVDREGAFEATKSWLQGLAIGINYTYCGIAKAYERLHGETLPSNKEESVLNSWFDHCAMQVAYFIQKHATATAV